MGATRAFYEEKRRLFPDINADMAAKEAADRVLRLIGQGGINSSSMSYAEGGLFEVELERAPVNVRQRAGAITTLDFVDQLRLHRYGLLPVLNDDIDWSTHIIGALQKYLDSL